jgi:hypothetical protein
MRGSPPVIYAAHGPREGDRERRIRTPGTAASLFPVRMVSDDFQMYARRRAAGRGRDPGIRQRMLRRREHEQREHKQREHKNRGRRGEAGPERGRGAGPGLRGLLRRAVRRAVRQAGPARQLHARHQQRHRDQRAGPRPVRHHRRQLRLLHPGPGRRPGQPGRLCRGIGDGTWDPGHLRDAGFTDQVARRAARPHDRDQRAEEHPVPPGGLGPGRTRPVGECGEVRHQRPVPGDARRAQGRQGRRRGAARAVRQRGRTGGRSGAAGRPGPGRDHELPGRGLRGDQAVGREVPAHAGGVRPGTGRGPADRRQRSGRGRAGHGVPADEAGAARRVQADRSGHDAGQLPVQQHGGPGPAAARGRRHAAVPGLQLLVHHQFDDADRRLAPGC